MIFLLATFPFLIAGNIFFYLQWRKHEFNSTQSKLDGAQNKSDNLLLKEKITNLSSEILAQNHKLRAVEQDNNELRNFKGRYEHAQSEINKLYHDKTDLLEQIRSLNHKIIEFEIM